MDTAFKNLIYDLYSKDLSQKITSVRRTKAAQGKFITCYALYGFKKSSNQRLIVDEESGEVVKRIFWMVLNGVSRAEITRILNKEGIPSPLMLRKQRKENFPNYHVNEQCHWTLSVVCKMLKDRRYVGDAVYGKLVPSAVGSSKDVPVPEEEWIVVPRVHEAIISREEFDKVQAIFTKHNYSRKKETSPFAGKVKCAVCNHTMPNQRKNSVKRGLQSAFRCNTSLSKPEYSCFTGTLHEKKLEEIVVNQLNWYAALAWDEKLQTAEERKREEQDILREEIIRLTKQLQVRKIEGLAEYEALKEGHISKESFLKNRVTLEQEAEYIMESIKEKERLVIEFDIKKNQVEENEFLLKQYSPFEKRSLFEDIDRE